MAGDTGVAGDTKPEVIAVASGVPEMGYMSPDESQFIWFSCEKSDQPGLCDANKAQYMGSALSTTRDWCGDGGGDNWKAASPACNINPNNLPPPMFISNATYELVAYRSALDLEFLLTLNNQNDFEPCTVGSPTDPGDPDSHLHGTELLNLGVKCNEHPTEDVYDRMVAFLNAHLP